MKFKKIVAAIGSVMMLGATVAGALAANYPSPFSASDTVVVYGNNLDLSAATTIANDLGNRLGGRSVSVSGGDSFLLEKSSSKIYLGGTLKDAYSSLDHDELKVGLAKGVYDSGDIEDVKYEQTIKLGSTPLTLFSDTKYKNKEATVGFLFNSNDLVLNYTIDFDDNKINMSKMADSDMPLLGGEYYVISANANEIQLLDSASTVILEDGKEIKVGGKTVSINWISNDGVILNVDGVNVKKLKEGGVAKLSDGSYVSIKNILTSSRESTVQKVEFSIGSGKIILRNDKRVIIGQDSDDEVDGLFSYIKSNSGYLNEITLSWKPKDKLFLTKENSITMPGFGKISLTFDGLSYPSSSEKIRLDGGSDTLVLDMGNFDIPLMWYDGTNYKQGEDGHLLRISLANYSYIGAGYSNTSGPHPPWLSGSHPDYNNTAVFAANAFALKEDDRFVVSKIDKDLSDAKTLYYEVRKIDIDGTKLSIELEDLIGSRDLKWDGTISNKVGTSEEAEGDIDVYLRGFNANNDTIYINFSTGVEAGKVVSEKGLVVTIPSAGSGAVINFKEANKDGDVNEGTLFSATVNHTSNKKLSVSVADGGNVTKKESSRNRYVGVVKSPLATKLIMDETGDEYDLEMEYFGSEAPAKVKVVVGGLVGSSSQTGLPVVTDSETSKMAGKNLVVVGGPCANAVAAELLGGNKCTSAFTSATGVGAGQFLIQSFNRNGKVALVVAGYEKEDTVKAANYLTKIGVDTAVGKKYRGTSETSATLVV